MAFQNVITPRLKKPRLKVPCTVFVLVGDKSKKAFYSIDRECTFLTYQPQTLKTKKKSQERVSLKGSWTNKNSEFLEREFRGRI